LDQKGVPTIEENDIYACFNNFSAPGLAEFVTMDAAMPLQQLDASMDLAPEADESKKINRVISHGGRFKGVKGGS